MEVPIIKKNDVFREQTVYSVDSTFVRTMSADPFSFIDLADNRNRRISAQKVDRTVSKRRPEVLNVSDQLAHSGSFHDANRGRRGGKS